MKQTGVVRWFRDDRGYGFITSQTGEDLFVHFSGIVGNGRKSLFPGQRVEFEPVKGPKGPAAVGVSLIEEEGEG